MLGGANSSAPEPPSAEHHSVLAILEAIGCGALILDAQGRVLQTNQKAKRYLGVELALPSRDVGPGSRSIVNHSVQVALRNALKASTQVLPQLSNLITVSRGSLRPLLLRSIRFPGEAAREGGARAALIVLDLEDFPEPDDETLRELFLLTPAEIRLAKHLARGESLSTIAEQLRVGLSTLRGQLKALFWKTGTSRQPELVALLGHVSRLNGSGTPGGTGRRGSAATNEAKSQDDL